MYSHKKELYKCDLCIFCTFCIYRLISNNPHNEFCNIHLSITAVGRQREVFRELHPGYLTVSLYHNITGIHFESLVNHKYILCSHESWMMNKPEKSFMQPMKVCLPWLNIYKCHTQLYAGLWHCLSSYSKLVLLCVCLYILFMWCQKLKVSCLMFLGLKELHTYYSNVE